MPDIALSRSGSAIALALGALLLTACSPWALTRAQDISPADPTAAAVPAVPDSSLVPATAPPLSSPSAAETPPVCQAGDLSATAYWQGAGGSRVGNILFTNQSAAACTLRGSPQVQIIDGRDQVLPVTHSTMSSGPPNGGVTVQPGRRASVRILWMNWCQSAPPGPIKLMVTLPDRQGVLDVPVLDPSGAPQAGAPRCDAPAASSSLSIGAF